MTLIAEKADADHDLAELSLNAALQLDKFLRDEDADSGVIENLGSGLRCSSGVVVDAGVHKLHADPYLIDLYSRALWSVSGIRPSNVDELGGELGELIEKASSPLKNCKKEDIERLKDFCLSLHRALLSEVTVFSDDEEPILPDDIALIEH